MVVSGTSSLGRIIYGVIAQLQNVLGARISGINKQGFSIDINVQLDLAAEIAFRNNPKSAWLAVVKTHRNSLSILYSLPAVQCFMEPQQAEQQPKSIIAAFESYVDISAGRKVHDRLLNSINIFELPQKNFDGFMDGTKAAFHVNPGPSNGSLISTTRNRFLVLDYQHQPPDGACKAIPEPESEAHHPASHKCHESSEFAHSKPRRHHLHSFFHQRYSGDVSH
jgi:hypothetical protein